MPRCSSSSSPAPSSPSPAPTTSWRAAREEANRPLEHREERPQRQAEEARGFGAEPIGQPAVGQLRQHAGPDDVEKMYLICTGDKSNAILMSAPKMDIVARSALDVETGA